MFAAVGVAEQDVEDESVRFVGGERQLNGGTGCPRGGPPRPRQLQRSGGGGGEHDGMGRDGVGAAVERHGSVGDDEAAVLTHLVHQVQVHPVCRVRHLQATINHNQ